MAEQPIKGTEIIESGALNDHINQLKEVNSLYKSLDEQIVKTGKDAKKASDNLSPRVAGSVKEAIKQEKVLSTAILEQEKIKRSKIQTEKQLMILADRKRKDDAREKKLIDQKNSAYAIKSKRLNKLRKDYKDLAVAGKGYSREARGMLREITKLDRKLVKLDASVGQNFRSVGKYSNALKGLKSGLARLGVGFAVFQGLRNSVSTIADFQQGVANLASVLGKSREEIKALSDDAKRLGSTTVFTASQVTKLQTAFSKLGFKEDEILNATEATLQLAAATGTDLEQAATVTAQTLNGFGLDASESQRIVDVMAKSFTTSALDMEKFSSAMSNVAPIAKQMNFSVERTTAILGKLVDTGVDASKAGTDLRQIFIKLSKSGLTFEQAMEKIQKSTNKTKTAVELFDVRAASSAVTLSENTEELNKMDEALQNAGGSAQEMADTQLDTLTGATKRLSSAWEGFILSLESGDGVLGRIIKGMIDLTSETLTMLSVLVDGGDAAKAGAISSAQGTGAGVAQSVIQDFRTLQQLSDQQLKRREKNSTAAAEILRLRSEGLEDLKQQEIFYQAVFLRSTSERVDTMQKELKTSKRVTMEQRLNLENQIGALESFENELRKNVQRFSDAELTLFSEKTILDTSKYGGQIRAILNSELQRRKDIAGVESEIEESTGKTTTNAKSTKKELTAQKQETDDLVILQKERAKELKILNDELKITGGLETEISELQRGRIAVLDEMIRKTKILRAAGTEQNFASDELDTRGIPTDKEALEEYKKSIEKVSQVREEEIEKELSELEDRNESIKNLSQQLTDSVIYFSDRRIEALERENDAEQRKYEEAKTREEQLIALRIAGVNVSEESLAFERQAQAQALAEQERIAKKKQRLQLLTAGLNAFNSQVQQGVGNPTGNTISQISQLISFLGSVPTFWTGTDTTVGDSLGTKVSNGRDGILARVDKDEMILNKEKSDKLKGLTTDQVTNYALAFQNGIGSMGVRTVTAIPSFDNGKIISALDEQKKYLQTIANKPHSNITLETLGDVTRLMEKTYKHNATTTKVTHKRLGR